MAVQARATHRWKALGRGGHFPAPAHLYARDRHAVGDAEAHHARVDGDCRGLIAVSEGYVTTRPAETLPAFFSSAPNF